jgi:hypothetical protein
MQKSCLKALQPCAHESIVMTPQCIQGPLVILPLGVLGESWGETEDETSKIGVVGVRNWGPCPFIFTYTKLQNQIQNQQTLYSIQITILSSTLIFRTSNFANSKSQTRIWEQCSNAPLHSSSTFDLRLVRQNTRKQLDPKFWEMPFPRALTQNYAEDTPNPFIYQYPSSLS